MTHRLAVLRRKATALICAALVLNQTWLAGCGQQRLDFPVTAAAFQLRLTPNHELSKALADSSFRDASGFEVHPVDQQFRVTFPSHDKQIVGTYAFVGGEFTITSFAFTRDRETISLDLGESKQIMRIATSDGAEWTRPRESVARGIPAARATGVDAYLAANADILEYARQLDQAAAGDKSQPGKQNAALVSVLGGILYTTALLWAPTALVLQVLVTIFVVSVVLQNVMIFRFDGNWTATNAGSTLALSIQNGRIIRLVDESAGQELTIVASDIQNVSGANVFWTVEANVDGQVLPVKFQFDMQETATGELTGSLTATGNTLGRVPMLMTRSA